MEINRKINQQLYIILAILIVVVFFMVILGATLSYFSSRVNATGQIQLGELDFNLTLTYSENLVMPGDTVETNAFVENKVSGKTNLIPFYFRFMLTNDDCITLNFDDNNYILGDDGYYYCINKVLKNKSEKLFSSFKIDESLTSIKELSFGIIIDAVQSEYGAYKDIFPTAPLEWVEIIENN